MKQKKIFVIISIFIFLISLTQKAFYVDNEFENSISSIFCLLMGWLGMAGFGASCFVWLANPLLFISWGLILKNKKIALRFSLAACIFSISFLLFKRVLIDEAGSYSKIISYGSGYWLWISSMLIPFFGCLLEYKRK